MQPVYRYDSMTTPSGQTFMLWGLEVLGAHPVFTEFLLMGYSLPPTAVRHMPAATHEFILCSIDPATPLDYGRSLFDQKSVSPMQPPNVGFQLACANNLDWFARLFCAVEGIQHRRLHPDGLDLTAWETLFIDGFALHRTPEAPLLQEAG